jgi:hypothetical protein
MMELKRLDPIGSDHFPMFTELVYMPEEAATQSTPKPRRSDEAEKKKKIKEGLDGD